MNRLQEYLVRAGNELGVQVIVPFEVGLRSGRKLVAEALLPQLGGTNGMLVFKNDDAAYKELPELGFGYTSYDEPSSEASFDVESYKEMFADWGWTSETSPEPKWME